MFYSQFILAKKGPLGTIWIAAHLERKLRKNQVADTDIGVSVDSILCPEVPIALRLSSHLLLGVVRIYSRKVNYLFDDCSDALLKVKQAFRSTAVDLPPEQSKAPYHSITLPETFDLDDFELPDNELFQGNDRHVSTREQITLQDTMDGGAFPTSQFGPDERFGDGDASQIGLDLDEDLFMEKGDAAGTSGNLNNTEAVQSPVKDVTSFKDDEHSERESDLPSGASTNHLSIQAPSTPGLMEEPNLPSIEETLISDDHMDEDQNIPDPAAKEVSGTTSGQVEPSSGLMEEPNLPGVEETLISDDHMDVDHNIPEPAAKEVSGTMSSQVEPSSEQNFEFNSNGNSHHLDEKDNEQVNPEKPTLPDEAAIEASLHGDAQILVSTEQIEATSDVESLHNKLDYTHVQNDGNVPADIQSFKGHHEHDEADLNRSKDVIFTEVNDRDTCVDDHKADLNVSYIPGSDIRSENNNSLAGQEVISAEASKTVLINNGDESQKSDQPFQNLKESETSKYNGSEKLFVFSTPVLKPCNSHSHNTCEVEKLADASKLSATDDELTPLRLSSKQDATNVAEFSTDVHELTMATPKADQIALESAGVITSCLVSSLDNDILGEEHLAKEINSKVSEFSAPEKLLSMPNLPADQPDSVVVEGTPCIEVARDGDSTEVLTRDGDASFENLLSGKKRSYTESTLTIQSLNSAASSGAAQSKQSAELVPEDDDLLSSILGGRSTAFKLKPTPPPAKSLTAKRQRTSVRSSVQKRKVVMDDSMVLHGDMIREQLTNTEDIRRVRKKAPCTQLEVWILQKQFLEDEVFSESVFTGYLPEFKCLHSEPRDLSGIRIVQDDGNKGIKKTDTSSLMHAEGVETETPTRHESMFGVDALQKELETFDNEVAKQMSKRDVPGEKAEMENNDQAGCEGNQSVVSTAELVSSASHVPGEKAEMENNDQAGCEGNQSVVSTAELVSSASHVPGEKAEMENNDQAGCEGNQSIVSTAEPASSASHVPEDTSELTDNTKVDTPYLHETTDVAVSADVDVSHQTINQDYHMESTKEDAFTMEEVSGSGMQYHEVVDVNVDGELDDKSLLDNRDGDDLGDTIVFMEDIQGTCSSPVYNIPITNSVDLEGTASPTSDRNIEELEMGEPRFENEEEVIASDIRHDDSLPTPNNILEEDVKIDPSCIVETDLCSEDVKLDEKEDSQCLETEPTLETDPVATPTLFINPEDQVEFGSEFIEHDTDFLNVDDDDAAEDHEDDMPNPEEKRMLDNSGWSSRTRAVANYLQGLFEKETRHAQKVIPLESLLVGKTRKEASRMFFETLVLKTKDYIEAEQADSFCEIRIKATGKLMKSEF